MFNARYVTRLDMMPLFAITGYLFHINMRDMAPMVDHLLAMEVLEMVMAMETMDLLLMFGYKVQTLELHLDLQQDLLTLLNMVISGPHHHKLT